MKRASFKEVKIKDCIRIVTSLMSRVKVSCSEGYSTYQKTVLTTSMEHNLVTVVSRYVPKHAGFQASLEITNKVLNQF